MPGQKEEGKQADSLDLDIDSADIDLTEDELENLVKEAQRAPDAKRKKKE